MGVVTLIHMALMEAEVKEEKVVAVVDFYRTVLLV
jgi:hypothetical protein